MEGVIKASDYTCVNCETQGKVKKAQYFVGLNELDAEYSTPLCKKCKEDWKLELLILLSGMEEDGL